MKGHLQIMAVFTVMLILIPMISLIGERHTEQAAVRTETSGESVLMLFSGEDEPREIPMRDYIIGAVFAQMPADFPEEALKAQAVLSRTYALRRRLEEKHSPTAALRGADMSDDRSLYQAYFTPEQAKDAYGSGYSEALTRISAAADAAADKLLTFEGTPIIAAFHAISSGMTDSAEEAWGESIPYLLNTDSSFDADNELCESTVSLSHSDLFTRLSEAYPDAGLSEAALSIEITERTLAGSAKVVCICGSCFVSGRSFAAAAGLSSPCFEVSPEGDGFRFDCKGRGHLVGMSQYGAKHLAENGKDFSDILSLYFPNTELKSSEKSE